MAETKLTEAEASRILQRVFAIQAEGTSKSESGYGAPYGAPFFIIDTSTAEPEVNWPGELIEQVDEIGEVGRRLHAARVNCLIDALGARPSVEQIAESIWTTTVAAICDEPAGREALRQAQEQG